MNMSCVPEPAPVACSPPPPSATLIPLRHLPHVGRCPPCLSKFTGHLWPSGSNVAFGVGRLGSRTSGCGRSETYRTTSAAPLGAFGYFFSHLYRFSTEQNLIDAKRLIHTAFLPY